MSHDATSGTLQHKAASTAAQLKLPGLDESIKCLSYECRISNYGTQKKGAAHAVSFFLWALQGGNASVPFALLGHLMQASNACPRIRRFEPDCIDKQKEERQMSFPFLLWALQGSNLRPLGCDPNALPAELNALSIHKSKRSAESATTQESLRY